METLALTLGVLLRVALPLVLLFGFSARVRAWDVQRTA